MKKGDGGYFRIARGSNTCGIGRSAIYLCPTSICSHPDINGLASYMFVPNNCQCGGVGYLGATNCDNGFSCTDISKAHSQCLTQTSARSAIASLGIAF